MDDIKIENLSYDELLLLYDKTKNFLSFLEKEKQRIEEDSND